MHCEFFGLSESPFGLTADPRFLYCNAELRNILTNLVSGISDRRGLMTIVGDSGTGKTTLLNAMLGRLDKKIKVARLSNTKITFEELLTMVLADLGLVDPLNRLSAAEAWRRLHEFAVHQQAEGGSVVLVVDEAQNLNGLCTRNLHRLIETDNSDGQLIQVILFRLPEPDRKLNRPAPGRFSEHHDMRWRIEPLNTKDTYAYIQHRLEVAGYKGPGLFTPKAQRLIWDYSRGVPRKINILCETALLIGYTQGKKRIRASLVQKAIKETSWRPWSGIGSGRHGRMAVEQCLPRSTDKISHARFALAASLMFAACLTLVTGLLVAHSRLKLKSRGSHAYHGAVHSGESVRLDAPIPSPMPGGQAVIFAGATVGQGLQAARVTAENIKSSGHLEVVSKEEKSPLQVAFLTPVDKERIRHGGGDSLVGRRPVKSHRAEERALHLKPNVSRARNTVIQVGAFRVRAEAERLVRRLRKEGYDPYLEIQTLQDLGLIHRVRVRGYGSLARAKTAMARLQALGFDDVFVVHLKTARPS